MPKVSEIRAQFPMYADMSDDQLLIGLHNKFYSDMPMQTFLGNIEYDTDRGKFSPKNDTGIGQKFLVGMGAATDRAVRGVKGLLGGEDKQGTEDAALYQQNHPGGWATAGEIVADGAMTALPAVKIAQAAKGLGTAGRILANVGGNAAVSAAMAPEDRGIAAVGGGVGAGLGMALGRVLPLATSAGRANWARNRAGRLLARDLGGEDAALAATKKMEEYVAARAAGSGITKDVPLTASQALRQAEGEVATPQSLALARRQLSVAGQEAPAFGQMVRDQNDALHGALGLASQDAGGLETAKLARDAATGGMREGALADASQASDIAAPLRAHIDELLGTSVEGGATNRIAQFVKRTVDNNPTPEKLYLLRKELKDMLHGPHSMNPDGLTSAVKGNDREVSRITSMIDNVLDEGSSGQWKPYLDTYKAASEPVNSARVQQGVLDAVNAPGGPLVGDNPELTRTVLKRALAKAGDTSKRFGTDNLTPEARGRFDELSNFMQRNEESMRTAKLGGTGGGGSQTAFQGGAASEMGPSGVGMAMNMMGAPHAGASIGAARGLSHMISGNLKVEVAKMLLNPEATVRGINRALAAGHQLSPAQTAFRASMVGLTSTASQPSGR